MEFIILIIVDQQQQQPTLATHTYTETKRKRHGRRSKFNCRCKKYIPCSIFSLFLVVFDDHRTEFTCCFFFSMIIRNIKKI